jgi:pseudouridine kinase
MTCTNTTIACLGGVVLDRKARVLQRLEPGTSNPVKVATCAGGVVANIARNLARLGGRPSLFSIVGQDSAAEQMLTQLAGDGVGVAGVARSTSSPTANYTAVLDTKGQLFIGLADMAIFDELDQNWADGIARTLARSNYWIVDANLPAATIERLLHTHKGDATVLADPISIVKSERMRASLDAVDVLFPNIKEAAVLSGLPVKALGDVPQAAAKIRERGVATVVVTLGEQGVYIDDPAGGRFVPAISTEQIRDVTGAGDALVAGYCYGLMESGPFDPVLWGLAAASLAVETEESVSMHLHPEALRRRIDAYLQKTSGA